MLPVLPEQITGPDDTRVGLEWADEPTGTTPLDTRFAGNLTTRNGLMTGFVNSLGDVKTYAYDALGELTRHTLAGGQEVSFSREQHISRDFYGYKVTRTSAAGRAQEWVFDVSKGDVETTDAAGIKHTGVTLPSGASRVQFASGEELELEMTPHARFGKQTQRARSMRRTLPGGQTHKTSFEYIENLALDGVTLSTSEQREVRDGIEGIKRMVYDHATRTVTTTSPMGRVHEVTYDEQMRIVGVEREGLARVEVEWNPVAGRLDEVRMVDPTGASPSRITTYECVEQDGLLETGSLARVQGPDGRELLARQDIAARKSTVVLPDQAALMSTGEVNELTQTWDARGVPMTHTAFAGEPTRFEFDKNDWSTAIHRPGVEAGDPEQTTRFVWDADGVLTRVEHADGSEETFTYKPGVRVLDSHSDQLEVRRPVYNAMTGLLERVEVEAKPGEPLGQARATEYVWNGTQLESETWFEGPGDELVMSVTYGYDRAFRQNSVSYPGYLHQMSYDADSRVASSGPLGFVYDTTHGLIDTVTHGSTTHTFEHDTFGALERIAHARQGMDRVVRQFGRDINGRVVREEVTREGQANTVRLYEYDERGHLTGVYHDANASGVADPGELVESYGWDERGNLIAREDPLDPETRDVRLGQDDSVHAWAGWELEYNGRGQVTRMAHAAKGVAFHLDVDQAGHTRQVRFDDGRRIEYGLDAHSRRVRRQAFDAQGNKVKDTRWVYAADSMRPTAEVDPQTLEVERVFIWGAFKFAPQAIVEPGGRELAVVSDERGSPLMVWDVATGQIIGEREYTAFGRITRDTLTSEDVVPFGFAGGVFDEWTGLVRLGARDYAPDLARFIAPDPLNLEAGPNLYQYSMSDPINATDSTGLFTETPLDIGFIGLSSYMLYRDNIAGNCDNLWTNLFALGADIASALIPFATGGGLGARLGQDATQQSGMLRARHSGRELRGGGHRDRASTSRRLRARGRLGVYRASRARFER